MDKRNNSASANDITETRNSIQNPEVRVLRSRAAKKPPGDLVDTLVKPSVKRIRRKRPTKRRPDDNELSKIRKQIRYFCTRISYHQTFLQAYASKGWKNQSMEKIRPEKELEQSKADMVRYKLRIREAFQNLDHLLTVGKPDESLFDSEGKISCDDIVCATCSLQDATSNNDIIFCDGPCDRGFHQNCLNPPLLTKDIPEEEWLCPACDCKIYCIELIKKFQKTDLSINDSWEKVFPEVAAMAHGPMQNDVPDLPSDDSEDDGFDPNISEEHVAGSHVEGSSEEDGDESLDSDDSNFITSSDNLEHVKEGEKVDDLGLLSDDSEDDDYDPARPDSDEDIEEKEDESDFTSDSDDFCADIRKSCHRDEVSSGRKVGDHTNDLEGAPVRPNTSMSYLTTKDIEIDQDAILPSRRRQVKPLDYKKLYDDAYGEAPSDSSDGEDWSGKSTLKEDSEEENEVDSFVHKSSRGTRAVHRDGFHGLVNDQHSRGLTSGPEVDHVVLPVSARQHIQSPESKALYAAYGKAPSGSSYSEDLSKKCTPETEFTLQSPQQSLNCSVNWQNTEELLTPNGSCTTGQKRHNGPIINQRLHEQFKIHQYPSPVVKESLAQELGLTFRQVEKWFENRRRHLKKASNKKSNPIENHSTNEMMMENPNVCKSDAVNEDMPSGILREGITEDGPLKQGVCGGMRTNASPPNSSQRYTCHYERHRKGESSRGNHGKNSSSSARRPKDSGAEYAVLALEAVDEKTRNKMPRELKKRKIG